MDITEDYDQPTSEGKKREVIYFHIVDHPQYRYIVSFTCMNSVKSKTYAAYVLFVTFYVACLSASTSIAVYLTFERHLVAIDALHTDLYCLFALLAMGLRHYNDKGLEEAYKMMKNGIYLYDDEDEEQLKIRREAARAIKYNADVIGFILFCCLLNLCFVTTFTKWYGNSEWVDERVNPYMPSGFYMPFFNTRTFYGYLIDYLVASLGLFYVVSLTLFIDGYYVSMAMATVGELRVLNQSIRTIQLRAYQMCLKKNFVLNAGKDSYKFASRDFQNCMVDRLKHNLRHHQAILRFIRSYTPYAGGTILYSITIGGVVWACCVFVMVENPNFGQKALFSAVLIGELLYNLQICYCAELVSIESENLFFALYGTPWIECNKEFKTLIKGMMVFSSKTLKLYCLGLSISASLMTYTDIFSIFYKIISVLREMK